MLFFNSSLRTRLSTEKAAQNLGMDVMVLNVSNTWNLEFEDGTVMNLDKVSLFQMPINYTKIDEPSVQSFLNKVPGDAILPWE